MVTNDCYAEAPRVIPCWQDVHHIQNKNFRQPSHHRCSSNRSFYPPWSPTEEYSIINQANHHTFTRCWNPWFNTHWQPGSTVTPQESIRVHVVPGLSCTSLLYINILWNAGCKISYDKEKCLICFKNRIVCQGTREPSTILWFLPLSPGIPPVNLPFQKITANKQYSGKAYQITSKGYLIWYLHQCIFCPTKWMLINAI